MRHDFFVELSRSRPTRNLAMFSSLRADARAGDGRSAVAGPGAGASDYFEGPVSGGFRGRENRCAIGVIKARRK